MRPRADWPRWLLITLLVFAIAVLLPLAWMVAAMLFGGGMGGMMGGMGGGMMGTAWLCVLAVLVVIMLLVALVLLVVNALGAQRHEINRTKGDER